MAIGGTNTGRTCQEPISVELTVTVTELGEWLGGITITPIVDQLRKILIVATQAVETFAPNAPQETKNQAVLRLSATIWHLRGHMGDRPSRITPNLFAASGAMALLAPFRESYAEICE